MAIWNDIAVVGYDVDPRLHSEAGSVFVYSRQDSGAWVLHEEIRPADGGLGDQFGSSLALEGKTLAVGAIGRDVAEFDCGSVYVFRLVGPNWVEVAEVYPEDCANAFAFGLCTGLRDGRLLIGMIQDRSGGFSASGGAYVFDLALPTLRR